MADNDLRQLLERAADAPANDIFNCLSVLNRPKLVGDDVKFNWYDHMMARGLSPEQIAKLQVGRFNCIEWGGNLLLARSEWAPHKPFVTVDGSRITSVYGIAMPGGAKFARKSTYKYSGAGYRVIIKLQSSWTNEISNLYVAQVLCTIGKTTSVTDYNSTGAKVSRVKYISGSIMRHTKYLPTKVVQYRLSNGKVVHNKFLTTEETADGIVYTLTVDGATYSYLGGCTNNEHSVKVQGYMVMRKGRYEFHLVWGIKYVFEADYSPRAKYTRVFNTDDTISVLKEPIT